MRGSDILGKIGGSYVPPSRTTLANAQGPFANKKFVTFLYENSSTGYAPGAATGNLSYVCNDMYDFDKSASILGNKQPLYYDSLLSASGPYKAYKVISWKTTFTFTNDAAVPLNVWVAPALTAAVELDSVVEADNYPGIKKLTLSAKGGSKDQQSITVKGHIDDIFSGFEKDLNMIGAYNGGPGSPIYGSVMVQSADAATAVVVYVRVKHEAYTELLQVDALVS